MLRERLFPACLLLAVMIWALPVLTYADFSSSEGQMLLRKQLKQEGYLGSFSAGQDLRRGISAYLWDNRNWFRVSDFHVSLNADAVGCLFYKKGYRGFSAEQFSSFSAAWCEKNVRKP